MIKYLREKITGRPAAFSPATDLSLHAHMAPMQKTHSHNNSNDVMSMSSNSNDTTSTNQVLNHVDKLVAASGGISSGRRPVCSSSSPIIIPKNPVRSNTSPPSSSSYTSAADQMSSLGETSFASRTESDDGHAILPTLPSACQQLEHSAARDRIAVKNKCRQPTKQKLSALREIDDHQFDLFASISDDEQAVGTQRIEVGQLPWIDTGSARAALHMSIRPRDRSADNILRGTHSPMSTVTSSVQRSLSFKRPQEINETKFTNRLPFQATRKQFEDEESMPNSFSSHEHIYDNLDLFKRHRISQTSDIVSVADDSSTTNRVQTRDRVSLANNRLRPITMIVASETEKQSSNEIDELFSQLTKRTSMRTVRPDLGIVPVYVSEEPSSRISATIPKSIAMKKPSDFSPVSPAFDRRKTVGGIHLLANNKVAIDETKPTPSWIDIAKQKQSKFQSVANEINESVPTTLSSSSRNTAMPMISSPTVTQQSAGIDIRLNRKSMYEPVLTRQSSPSATTPVIDRDSIRALKSGNPNRINNLIQFFDK